MKVYAQTAPEIPSGTPEYTRFNQGTDVAAVLWYR